MGIDPYLLKMILYGITFILFFMATTVFSDWWHTRLYSIVGRSSLALIGGKLNIFPYMIKTLFKNRDREYSLILLKLASILSLCIAFFILPIERPLPIYKNLAVNFNVLFLLCFLFLSDFFLIIYRVRKINLYHRVVSEAIIVGYLQKYFIVFICVITMGMTYRALGVNEITSLQEGLSGALGHWGALRNPVCACVLFLILIFDHSGIEENIRHIETSDVTTWNLSINKTSPLTISLIDILRSFVWLGFFIYLFLGGVINFVGDKFLLSDHLFFLFKLLFLWSFIRFCKMGLFSISFDLKFNMLWKFVFPISILNLLLTMYFIF